jgi:hypothetical protein
MAVYKIGPNVFCDEPGPEPGIKGDVNGDQEVTIADVNVVIDMIISGKTDLKGDVNGDQEISIADVNVIIDIILHKS